MAVEPTFQQTCREAPAFQPGSAGPRFGAFQVGLREEQAGFDILDFHRVEVVQEDSSCVRLLAGQRRQCPQIRIAEVAETQHPGLGRQHTPRPVRWHRGGSGRGPDATATVQRFVVLPPAKRPQTTGTVPRRPMPPRECQPASSVDAPAAGLPEIPGPSRRAIRRRSPATRPRSRARRRTAARCRGAGRPGREPHCEYRRFGRARRRRTDDPASPATVTWKRRRPVQAVRRARHRGSNAR